MSENGEVKLERCTGKVKFFDADGKGWGFFSRDDGKKDIFVHVSALVKSGVDPTLLEQGDKVEFDIKPAGKGPQAVNIKVVSP